MTNRETQFHTFSSADFNRRIEEGMRRAPQERAKAIKEFWGWLTRS